MGTRRFYKFRSLASSCDQEVVRRAICDLEIWMSSRTGFNDPFDCRPRFVDESTEETRIRWLAAQLALRHPDELPEALAARATRRIQSAAHGADDITADQFRRLEAGMDAVGICSLTTTCDEILLWSHYADSHRGICLVYEVSEEGDPLAAAREVAYGDTYPVIRLFEDADPDRFRAAVLQKSRIWAYEREWRIVNVNRCNYALRVLNENLTGVIFGARTADANRELLKNWIRQSPARIALQSARIRQADYGLEFVNE